MGNVASACKACGEVTGNFNSIEQQLDRIKLKCVLTKTEWRLTSPFSL